MNKIVNGEPILDRIKVILGFAQDKDVAGYFGVSPTSVYNWRKRGTIPYEECVRISVDKGVSLDWLILGAGSEGEGESSQDQGFAVYDQFYVEVPLYDIRASAGDGSLFEEERIDTYLKFRRDWVSKEGLFEKDLVGVRVAGDSMDGTLQDGDMVLVNRARTQPDGVFLVRVGESLHIKRLQHRTDGAVRISSDNDLYEPEVVPPERLSQVEIIGHCHWRAGRVY